MHKQSQIEIELVMVAIKHFLISCFFSNWIMTGKAMMQHKLANLMVNSWSSSSGSVTSGNCGDLLQPELNKLFKTFHILNKYDPATQNVISVFEVINSMSEILFTT